MKNIKILTLALGIVGAIVLAYVSSTPEFEQGYTDDWFEESNLAEPVLPGENNESLTTHQKDKPLAVVLKAKKTVKNKAPSMLKNVPEIPDYENPPAMGVVISEADMAMEIAAVALPDSPVNESAVEFTPDIVPIGENDIAQMMVAHNATMQQIKKLEAKHISVDYSVVDSMKLELPEDLKIPSR